MFRHTAFGNQYWKYCQKFPIHCLHHGLRLSSFHIFWLFDLFYRVCWRVEAVLMSETSTRIWCSGQESCSPIWVTKYIGQFMWYPRLNGFIGTFHYVFICILVILVTTTNICAALFTRNLNSFYLHNLLFSSAFSATCFIFSTTTNVSIWILNFCTT